MKAVFVILLTLTYGCGGHSSLGQAVESATDKSEKNSADSSRANAPVLPPEPVTAEGIGAQVRQTDEFNQSQKGLLDILLVIDNSGSMDSYQGRVASNLAALLQYISDSDWQIAVIGTKLSSCLSERITKNTPDVQSKYRSLVAQLRASGNGEYHFYKAIHGLKGECRGTVSSWLRDGSTIAVLIVSDQHNECHDNQDGDDSGQSLPRDGLCRGSDLIAHLQAIRPRGNAKLYGIVSRSAFLNPKVYSRVPPYIRTYADPGALNIFDAYGSIGDMDYSGTLQKISQSVQTALEDVFALTQVPLGEVEVKVNGAALTSAQFTIDAEGKQLKFDRGYVPPENAAITVSYSYRYRGN